jgi:hypothetical protein
MTLQATGMGFFGLFGPTAALATPPTLAAAVADDGAWVYPATDV